MAEMARRFVGSAGDGVVDDTVGTFLERQDGEEADLPTHVNRCGLRFSWLRARIDRSDRRMIVGFAILAVIVMGHEKAGEILVKALKLLALL